MNPKHLVFLTLSLGATTLPAFADTAEQVQELACAETAFSRAAEARDLAAFLALIDPDARFANASVARGKEQIAEAWAAFFDPEGPVIRWRPSVTEVSDDGTLGFSRGPFRISGIGSDGKPRETWGHFISTWRKSAKGEWLVLFDSGGDTGMSPDPADVTVLESEPDCSS